MATHLNTRAVSAESDLSREKELRKNYEYHYKGTLEMMQNQLAEANAKIHELEMVIQNLTDKILPAET